MFRKGLCLKAGQGSRDASSGTLDAGTRDVGRGEVTSGT